MKKTIFILRPLSKTLMAATLILFAATTTFAQHRGGGREGSRRNEDPARFQNNGSMNAERRPNTAFQPRADRPNQGGIARSPERINRQPLRDRTINNNNRRPPGISMPATARRPVAVNNRPGPVGSANLRPGYGSINRPAYRPVYGTVRPVYNPRNPGWRYGYLPRRNSYFYSLPSTYISINFGGFGYRYWNGVYYRPYNNLFTVVAPPIGIFINTLPIGYSTLYVRDYPYYYYNGTYYDKKGTDYYVVSPPVGAVVESLPAGYETVVIDGETYYTIDGAQYKPVVKENGEIWYEVIKAN